MKIGVVLALEAIELLRPPLEQMSEWQMFLLALWIVITALQRILYRCVGFLYWALVRSVLAGEVLKDEVGDEDVG
jgi:hypothetical protein